MRPRHVIVQGGLLAAAVVLVAAPGVSAVSEPPAGSSGNLPGLAELGALDANPDDCPIDLVGAIEATGFQAFGQLEAEVEVTHGRELPPVSSIAIDDLTSLDLAGGTIVECRVDLSVATVTAMLHASPNERATMGTFFPRISFEGEVAPTDLQAVSNRLFLAPVGEVVDISDLTDRPIALARPVIAGAADATMLVYADVGDDESSAPTDAAIDVHAIAEELVGVSSDVVTFDDFVDAAVGRYGFPEAQARCVFEALDGDVAAILAGGPLDLPADELERLSAALVECEATAPTAP